MPDRDGFSKPVVQVVVQEALTAGIEEICIVGQPGSEPEFRRYFAAMPEDLRPRFQGKEWAYDLSDALDDIGGRLSFVEQPQQQGLGHAVWCAREWADGGPVLVLLGDHIYVSTSERPCGAQIRHAFCGCNLTALVPVGRDQLSRFGVAAGRLRQEEPFLLDVSRFIEKPDEETARQHCSVEGLPEGRYLAHFGMHVFTPTVFDVLDDMIAADRRENGEFQLTTAQDTLCQREPYQGLIMRGVHYDVGTPAGMLEAELALALDGEMREDVQRMWRRAVENHLR